MVGARTKIRSYSITPAESAIGRTVSNDDCTRAICSNVIGSVGAVAGDIDAACMARHYAPSDGSVPASHPVARSSTVEHRPADVVSQPLVVEDEFADCIRELFALPTALEPSGAVSPAGAGCGRSELVRGDVRHDSGLTGCMCGMPSRSARLPCRTHGMAARGARLRHCDLAASPCPNLLDCLEGPRIRGPHRLEEMQNVLCARGRPESQEAMVGVRERGAATDRDEATVTVLGQDHATNRMPMKIPTDGAMTLRTTARLSFDTRLHGIA